LEGEKKSKVFDFDFTNMNESEAVKANLLILLSGVKCEFTEKQKDIFESYTMPILHNHSIWEKLTKAQKSFVAEFLFVVFSILRFNIYGIRKQDSNPRNETNLQLGSGHSSFFSMLSHSCALNLTAISIADKLLLVTTRPIKKGEQLYISYAPPYACNIKEERQAYLQKVYQFICSCEACENDYPLAEELPVNDPKFLQLSSTQYEMLTEAKLLTSIEQKEIWKAFKDYCVQVNEMFGKFEAKQPSKEISDLQYVIPMFFKTISDSTIKLPSS